MPCRVDGDLRRGHGERPGQLEASACRVETRAERGEPVHRREQEIGRVGATFGEGDSATGGRRERLDALPPSDLGDLLQRGRRRGRTVETALEQPRLDELREERRGEQVRPPELVEPAYQERRRSGGSPRAMRTATRARRASGSASSPSSSCSASSKRPWSTRISARRADGGMQRERWPAAVSSRTASSSSSSAESIRPFAA